MKEFTEEELREEAEKRIAFKTHAAVYVVVNIFIWGVYLITGVRMRMPWSLWATLGWAIGFAFHYIAVYRMNSIFSIEKEMDKLRKQGK